MASDLSENQISQSLLRVNFMGFLLCNFRPFVGPNESGKYHNLPHAFKPLSHLSRTNGDALKTSLVKCGT